ncbi:MAG: hypothetical protein JST28_09205 [Acidobacteria bacterium]|nr:hypothetical protein [Acidobacteriota bacterium]
MRTFWVLSTLKRGILPEPELLSAGDQWLANRRLEIEHALEMELPPSLRPNWRSGASRERDERMTRKEILAELGIHGNSLKNRAARGF